jgi:UDP-N-acetylglucosamine--N-acetylmuramyl-(pentapeptide) pyrophosphoryl-undecaprenol N-acetylglucosamine transferase
MKVLIADGGTGGHIFPAIAVADELKKRHEVEAILFTGTELGFEKDLVPRHGYELKLIRVGGLIGKSVFVRMKTLMQLPFAYLECRRILKEFSPSVVIGFGAYASGPALVAAARRKIPILMVEPNAVPGFTNRMALRFAAKVAVPFEDTRQVFAGKAMVTGIPIRRLTPKPHSHEKFTVGIFGGSQGAHAINTVVTQALPQLATLQAQMHLIHQTGKRDFDEIRTEYDRVAPFYEVTAFVHNVEDFYNRCDLLICRSGAITLAEITALGKPAILVPLPTSTHGHQEENARRLAQAGAAEMILQKDFTETKLLSLLKRILAAPETLRAMAAASLRMGKPDAARVVADLALEIALHR